MTLADTVTWLRGGLTALHPRGRRWLQFLHSLPLDPDRLPRPLEPPGEADFILCGAPRTGTTLLAGMLFQPPRVVTVMEPWAGMRLPPAPLFATIRAQIEREGVLRHGKLDVEALAREGAVRRVAEGESAPALALEPGFHLGIKWPAFWRYLDLLPRTRFLVCVRDPFEVVSSFKKEGGRLRLGLEYDTAFNRRVNRELRTAARRPQLRRVLLYEYINSCIVRHADRPNVFLVRYERWFRDPETLLAEIGAFLGVELSDMPAKIRRPPRESLLSPAEQALVREHCASAVQLGYCLEGVAT